MIASWRQVFEHNVFYVWDESHKRNEWSFSCGCNGSIWGLEEYHAD